MTDDPRVLVDTNVWIDFLGKSLPALRLLVKRQQVITHTCVIGEMLVGSVSNRAGVREFLLSLPLAKEANLLAVLGMIESRKLFARGLQWNDVQLLAAAKLSNASLWTRDKRLAAAAAELGCAWTETDESVA